MASQRPLLPPRPKLMPRKKRPPKTSLLEKVLQLLRKPNSEAIRSIMLLWPVCSYDNSFISD